MSEFKHLMLAIETMGNQSYASIISIGALEFDIETGVTGKEFYADVSLQSCIDLGLTISASTIKWWLRQSDNARLQFANAETTPILEVLSKFSDFCNKEYEIWGNSARFDCGILQNAYDKANAPIPWDFRKERCVRTLVSFNPSIKETFPSAGIAHNALHDCYFQVGYCSAIWKSLKGQ